MKNFLVQVWSTYKGLCQWLSWSTYIPTVFLLPAIQIILWSILGRFAIGTEGAQRIALGLAVLQMNGILVGGIIQTYSFETEFNTLSFFYVSPVNRLVNLISRSVLHYPNALLTFISAVIAAKIVIGLNFGMVNWLGFTTAILIIAASVTSFAQFLGMYALATKNWIPLSIVSGSIISLLTGAVIPVSAFPAAVQELAKLLPITNGLFAIRATFAGAPMADVYGYVLREALTGIVYFLLAIVAFRYIELWAKRTGALSVES